MGEGSGLDSTPTWVVAIVCTIIVAISLLVQQSIHHGREYLKGKKQKALFEALEVLKEELMLLGFISLMLNVLQDPISKICIPKSFVTQMLPCYTSTSGNVGTPRRKLLGMAESPKTYCDTKAKVPFLSVEELHQLHIFIFVLAVVHITFSMLTIVFGGARIRKWEQWENDVPKENNDTTRIISGGHSRIIGWAKSFFKQFYAAVTKDDYAASRLHFTMTRRGNSNPLNFHNYMIHTVEDDFKRIVGISWYLWVFVIIFLLLNIKGWHTYFWIAFLPFILLLGVGTKLQHVITHLFDMSTSIEGGLVTSDVHFWFNRPKIILFLIHFSLFQNAFEIAFFFWIWVRFRFDSCITGEAKYILPRLIIGVIIQILCSYSTIPLYAIFKAIFNEHVRVNGSIQPESTTSTTDGGVRSMEVDLNQLEGSAAPSARTLARRRRR